MRIDRYQAGEIYRSFAQKAAQTQAAGSEKSESEKAEKADKTRRADRVEISREASAMRQARELSSRLSTGETVEDRQARIADIQNRIEKGQYDVPSSDVARSILVGSTMDFWA